MVQVKKASVSTHELIRRINCALTRSRLSVWFPPHSRLGPYMIVRGDVVQASGIENVEGLARELGVMRDWEVWDQ